jgi:hypothetical protein
MADACMAALANPVAYLFQSPIQHELTPHVMAFRNPRAQPPGFMLPMSQEKGIEKRRHSLEMLYDG